MSTFDVVTIGEALGVMNSPHDTPLERAREVRATFAGAESNVAIGLARLGHLVRWLSVLGEDPFGWRIFKTLQGESVDVSQVIWSLTHPTAVMFKSRRGHAEPLVYYYRSTSAFSQSNETTFAPETWRDAKILYLTGITPALSEGCLALVRAAITDARASGMTVWLDPNYRRKLWSPERAREVLLEFLPQVDCVLAGLSEGEMLTGEIEPGRINEKIREQGPHLTVVKDGEKGSHALSDQGAEFAPSFGLRQMVDPIGAGDAYAAGFLSAYLSGFSVGDCLRHGNAAGAIVCQAEGDWEGLPTRGELDEFLQSRTAVDR